MRHMVIVVAAQRLISSASCGGTLDAAIFVRFPMCTLERTACGSYCEFLLQKESEQAGERETRQWRSHERGGKRICVRQKHSWLFIHLSNSEAKQDRSDRPRHRRNSEAIERAEARNEEQAGAQREGRKRGRRSSRAKQRSEIGDSRQGGTTKRKQKGTTREGSKILSTRVRQNSGTDCFRQQTWYRVVSTSQNC